MNAPQLAVGKWRGILVGMGLPESFLINRHGPCPLCGGKDRWRFDDKEGKGTFICSHCGAGDGFDLAIKYTGRPFAEIAAEVEKLAGAIQAEKPRVKRDPRQGLERVGKGLQRLNGKDPATLYLRGRGITGISSYGIRFHPELPYYDQGAFVGKFPAMVAKVCNVQGKGETYHLTYLTVNGKKADVSASKKIMPPIRTISGGAIRLSPAADHIGITEGIENGLAVMEGEGIPCWAAVSAGGLESFEAPQGIKRISIFADNDTNFTGHKAAYSLANRMIVRHGIEASVIVRGGPGEDYLDFLIRSRRAVA